MLTKLAIFLRREPLVQFLLLGLLLTVAARFAAPPADTSRQLLIDQPVQAGLARAFVEARGRLPEPAEMNEMVDRWILNEVLFREAKALGLDGGDEMIRERIITKMRVMLQGQLVEEQPTEADLEDQFNRFRAEYDEPTRYDFVAVIVPGGEAEAQRLAANVRQALADGGDAEVASEPGIPYEDRPGPSLAQAFGPAFVTALDRLPLDRWEPLEGKDGWQLVRLFRRAPGRAVTLAEVRGRVENDWRRRDYRERSWRSVQALQRDFTIVRPDLDPATLLSEDELQAALKAGDRDGYRPLPRSLGG